MNACNCLHTHSFMNFQNKWYNLKHEMCMCVSDYIHTLLCLERFQISNIKAFAQLFHFKKVFYINIENKHKC